MSPVKGQHFKRTKPAHEMEDENAAAATIHSLELAPEPAGDSVSTLSGGVASANSLSPVLVTGRRQWMPRSPPRGMYSQGEEDMESVESDDEGGYMGENRERRDSAPARLDAESTELSPAGSEGKQWRRATAGNLVSSQSILSDGLEDDDDEDQWLSRRDVDSDVTSSTRAVKILGVDLPLWCTRGPSWNRIASFVVRRAPCFWCCGNALEVGATDRSILYRLNVLCCFFTSGQVLSGIFLVFAFYSPGLVNRDGDVLERNESPGITPNLWNINGSIFLLAIIGTFGLITMFYTLGVVREVNLVGTIRYMWVMVWLIPLQIFVVISVVDYHRVTDVWLRHWWTVPSLAWFRSMFCRDGTFNTLCIVPVLGGEGFESEEEWCLNYFNVTNCADIRDSAQRGMSALVYFFYNINFGKSIIPAWMCCGVSPHSCAMDVVWGLGLVLLVSMKILLLSAQSTPFLNMIVMCWHSLCSQLKFWKESSQSLLFRALGRATFLRGSLFRQLGA